jgi:regulator of replication initiation timing
MYAFMIYYNNSRNKLFRQIDNLKMKIHGSKRRLGIMQVEVDHVISDSLSIEMALDKIKKNYKKSGSKKAKIKDVIHAYDKENEKEIESIFDTLSKF